MGSFAVALFLATICSGLPVWPPVAGLGAARPDASAAACAARPIARFRLAVAVEET